MHPLPVNSIEIPALLIIDMQQGIQRVSTPRNNPQAETQIAQLLEYWRSADLPLVHIRHMSRQADSVLPQGKVAPSSSRHWRHGLTSRYSRKT